MKVRTLDDFLACLDAFAAQDIERYETALLADNVDVDDVRYLVDEKREWWKAFRQRLPDSLPAEMLDDAPALRGLRARIAELDAAARRRNRREYGLAY